MNYRHAYHAGNHGDVLKHATLTAAIGLLHDKPAPLFLLDTHAGIGVYDLTGVEAGKTGEFESGIGAALAADVPAIQPYIDIVRSLNNVLNPSDAQLRSLIGEASFSACLSAYEGFGLAAVEAMSAGCCLVSTPTDGVLEQIENGVSGYIASSFDPLDLAKALSSAVANPAQRLSFAEAGRDAAGQKFSEDAMIKSHIDLYQSTLQSWHSKQASASEGMAESAKAETYI